MLSSTILLSAAFLAAPGLSASGPGAPGPAKGKEREAALRLPTGQCLGVQTRAILADGGAAETGLSEEEAEDSRYAWEGAGHGHDAGRAGAAAGHGGEAAGRGHEAEGHGREDRRPSREDVRVEREDVAARRVRSFSAARTLDIELWTRLRHDVRRDSRLEFHVYTPQGHLYQRLRALPQVAVVVGERDRRRSRERVSVATLPTAGTTIVNSSLYGRWRVEPHLDGELRPCAPALRFQVGP
jgi:hypothetical protein